MPGAPSPYTLVHGRLIQEESEDLRQRIAVYERKSLIDKITIFINPFNWENIEYETAREILNDRQEMMY